MTGGEYFTFNASANDTILFSFCGNASWDTEIRILDNLGNDLVPAFGDDDGCLVPYGPSELSFYAPYNGSFRIFTTQFPCAANSTNATLSYTLINQPPPAIYNLTSQYGPGWFIEGVTNQINIFSVVSPPVGTTTVGTTTVELLRAELLRSELLRAELLRAELLSE